MIKVFKRLVVYLAVASISISMQVGFSYAQIATSTATTTPTTAYQLDPSLIYGDSEVPVILPRSVWDNSSDLHNLLTWIPQNETFPSDWQPVERIIIHHTATPNDDPYSAISRIQSIYRFHAVTQGWGDIGYNYIIDQQGKIYEGRYGGNGSRGAHTYYDREHDNFNFGSIGIALIGTYTSQDISPAMYESLSRLIGWLTTTNGLDPFQMNKTTLVWNPQKGGFSSYYTLPVVLGHKDIESTNCPGLIDLTKIRQKAAEYRNKYQNYIYQAVVSSGTIDPNTYSVVSYGAGVESKIYKIISGLRKAYNSLSEYTSSGSTYSKIVLINKPQLELFSDKRFYKYFSGTLIKSENFPKIYLIEDGKIRHFEMSPTQFITLGYNFESVKAVPQEELDFYVLGQPILYGPDNSLVKKNNDPTVYFIEKGRKRHMGSAALFNFLGFVWSKIKTLSAGEVDSYLNGMAMTYPDGVLVKADNSSTVYLINNNQLHPFLSASIFINLKYNWKNIKILPASEINSLAKSETVKYPDGTLIKSDDSPSIYVIKNGQKEIISSAEAFTAAGYSWANIITLAVNEFDALYPGVVASGYTDSGSSSSSSSQEPKIKVAIQEVPVNSNVLISANGPYQQCDINNICQTKTGQSNVSYSSSAYAKFIPDGSSILEIVSYTDWNWNKSANYNQFRGVLEVKYSSKTNKLWIVNELNLEDYLKGIGEVNNSDAYEYIKTLIVAARTYAYNYIKLGGKYGADEVFYLKNTAADQLYKGYGREQLAPSIVKAVDETRGEIITYNSNPIVAAYSSGAAEIYQSGTRSACSVWGGKYCQPGYEYLSGGVKDPEGAPYTRTSCGADNHCVGMSAAGGRRWVELGKSYKEILMYYYKGTAISKSY